MRYDDITVKLLDKEGFVITEQECETVKYAKERAKYYLSKDYARGAETTHEALGTYTAQVICDGEIIHDYFL